jgi:alkenylglycerophosphocholine/alkenylglycerophosphoethanolamine hydrolase
LAGSGIWLAQGKIYHQAVGHDRIDRLVKHQRWLAIPCDILPGGSGFLAAGGCLVDASGVYIVGFSVETPVFTPLLILLTILTIGIAVFVTRKIRQGVFRKTGARRIRWSVTLYSIVITIMFLSALATIGKPGWEPANYLSVALGGLLFYLSDTMLAYDRFVTPIRYGRLFVRITYHIGQILLLTGAVNHFVH